MPRPIVCLAVAMIITSFAFLGYQTAALLIVFALGPWIDLSSIVLKDEAFNIAWFAALAVAFIGLMIYTHVQETKRKVIT